MRTARGAAFSRMADVFPRHGRFSAEIVLILTTHDVSNIQAHLCASFVARLNCVSAADASAPAARVATVLGTMSIPNPLDVPATREALDYFTKAGFEEIDTAIMYQGGKSEGALGERELCCADGLVVCSWLCSPWKRHHVLTLERNERTRNGWTPRTRYAHTRRCPQLRTEI